MGFFVFVIVLSVVGVGVWAALNKEQAQALVNQYLGGQNQGSVRSGPTGGVNTARKLYLAT